jgi:hypothetical protein
MLTTANPAGRERALIRNIIYLYQGPIPALFVREFVFPVQYQHLFTFIHIGSFIAFQKHTT